MPHVHEPLRAVVFGSYDADRHPRVAVLRDGLAARGLDVTEVNEPLGDSTEERVALAGAPWRAPRMIARVRRTWATLRERAQAVPDPDVVVVGYLGHVDVHLARRLWPDATLVLDHLVGLGDTLRDRGANRAIARTLETVDRAALRAADVVVVDTEEQRMLLPPEHRSDAIIVPVGATEPWFRRPATRHDGPVRAVFFGLFTPLHGAPVIGRAAALLAGTDVRLTMIGHGQTLDETRSEAGDATIAWHDWVPGDQLPDVVAGHDVCLGIFGTTDKAGRVVPTKLFQGAAAGCAIVTSDTLPQRVALGGAGTYVPSGDASALAAELKRFADDRAELEARRRACRDRAEQHFRPEHVVGPLLEAIVERRTSLAVAPT